MLSPVRKGRQVQVIDIGSVTLQSETTVYKPVIQM